MEVVRGGSKSAVESGLSRGSSPERKRDHS